MSINKALTGIFGALTSLIPALTGNSQNGLSLLGTLSAPTFPDFLTNNPLPLGFPWGGLTAAGTNPYEQSPTTGVTRNYEFTASRGQIAPDGVQRQVILINGQFPGPTIEANWGDWIQVTVHNNLTTPQEGLAFHWHGILQKGNQWMDGVPAVQQCPIPPQGSFTYRFKADLYGTSWYHSHYSAQYAGGLLGPMIIHGPKNVPYDIDLGPVFLTDYYHPEYYDLLKDVMGTDLSKVAPASDNNLINGKGITDCSKVPAGTKCTPNAGLSKFKFTTGKKHRLRLINAGAEGIQKFSIDNHDLTVMAVDFVPIKPYTTKVVTLGIGQRTDIIVTANGKATDAVWMRSTISSCSVTNQPIGLAGIFYPSANTSALPQTTAQTDTTDPCANDALTTTEPFFPLPVLNPATTINVDVGITVNSTGHLVFTMNNQTFRGNYNNPVLLLAKAGNTSYPMDPEWNVYNTGQNTSYRFVINNKTPIAHPMHFHGHNMFVLAEGTGTWDGKIVRQLNPVRRDVQQMRPNGYMVFQANADNPGVWPFHCHIAWHVSGGLYINVMERPNDIKNLAIPSTFYQTCRDWAAYTNTNVVPQIDSGL